MFPPFHEFLVDNLARIVFSRLNVYSLFNDSIRPTPKGLACAIL